MRALPDPEEQARSAARLASSHRETARAARRTWESAVLRRKNRKARAKAAGATVSPEDIAADDQLIETTRQAMDTTEDAADTADALLRESVGQLMQALPWRDSPELVTLLTGVPQELAVVMRQLEDTRRIRDMDERVRVAGELATTLFARFEDVQTQRMLACLSLHLHEGWSAAQVYQRLDMPESTFTSMRERARRLGIDVPVVPDAEDAAVRSNVDVLFLDALQDDAFALRRDAMFGLIGRMRMAGTAANVAYEHVSQLTGLSVGRIKAIRRLQVGEVPSPEVPYRRIADLLRARLEDGTYQPGTGLPGEHRLAAELGVTRRVVEFALSVLRDEGRVESRPKTGWYVTMPAVATSGSPEPATG